LAADQPAARPDAQRQGPAIGGELAAQPPLEAQRLADPHLGLGPVPGEHLRGVLVLEDRPTEERGVLGQVRVGERAQGEAPGAQHEAGGRVDRREAGERRHRASVAPGGAVLPGLSGAGGRPTSPGLTGGRDRWARPRGRAGPGGGNPAAAPARGQAVTRRPSSEAAGAVAPSPSISPPASASPRPSPLLPTAIGRSAWETRILRGLAASATGIVRRSTPSL